MIGDLVTGTELYCQDSMMPKRLHIRIVSIMVVSVMLIAFSFTLAFGQSSGLVKILSFRNFIDGMDYYHVVGEIENDSPSEIKYVLVMATFYNVKNQEVGTSVALTTPMDIGLGNKAPFDLSVSAGSVPIRDIANYSIRVIHE
jgi:hypothetical protein